MLWHVRCEVCESVKWKIVELTDGMRNLLTGEKNLLENEQETLRITLAIILSYSYMKNSKIDILHTPPIGLQSIITSSVLLQTHQGYAMSSAKCDRSLAKSLEPHC